MSKEKIIKLEDSKGTVAYYEDHMNWLTDKKGMFKYKEELEGHKFKKVYIGVKKHNNTLPFSTELLFEEFTEKKPNLSFSRNDVLYGYVKDQSGTFIFENYFQEPFDITWQKITEKEDKKITNKYKSIGYAARGTSSILNILINLLVLAFATNFLLWWLW